MIRWKLTIEYVGTGYSGWQRQEEGVPTVQHAVEEAIYKFCQQHVTLHVAGRTDAGVHARGQVAHFDLARDINGYEDIELTHAAIAAYILCGRADAGLGVETAARQFDLEFIPLLSERYLLVCDASLLKDPRFAPVLELLQSSEFRMEVNKLPGYDAVETGTIAEVGESYPYFAGGTSASGKAKAENTARGKKK